MDSKYENITLSYLLSGTNNCLPPSYLKLRSYLTVYSSNVAGYFGYKLPKSLTSKNKSCPFCFTPWTQNTVSFKLFPSPRKKIKESCFDQNKTEESVYLRNKLVLQCKLCRKKSSFSLIKKKNSEKKLEQLATDDSKIKKKKRKDKNNHSGSQLESDKKLKENNASGSKNERESLKSSNSSQVTTCVKATTQNSKEQKKLVKNKTNVDDLGTENLKATKKNMKTGSVINPNALLDMKKSKGKKKSWQKFKNLKKVVSQERITAKKTLTDFLTLVNK